MGSAPKSSDADVVAKGVSLVSHMTDQVQPGSGRSGPPVGGSALSPGTASGIGMGLALADKFAAVQSLIASSGGSGGGGVSGGTPLSDKDKLLLCLPDIAKTMAGRQEKAEDRQGWLYLHSMLQRWFSGPASNQADKCGEPFWVDWDWAMRFPRAYGSYRQFTDMPVKRQRHVCNAAAQKQLGKILCRHGYMHPEQRLDFDFTVLSWTEWEIFYHTLIAVGRVPIQDGLMASLAGFTLRALAGGYTEPDGHGGHTVHVRKMAVFVHDRFQFEEDSGVMENSLGWWSCEKKEGGAPVKPLMGGETYHQLFNVDFRNFAARHGFGRDLLVLSRPHMVADFTEQRYEYTCP